jgi:TPP-dependent indolepyruvate ferredoxin oxidoreductase alpha subunit
MEREIPLCFGTDEFSSKCTICKNCFMKYECSKIEPKIPKNKRKQYRKPREER